MIWPEVISITIILKNCYHFFNILCARYSKYFLYISVFNSQEPYEVGILVLLYRWWKWGTEKLNNLSPYNFQAWDLNPSSPDNSAIQYRWPGWLNLKLAYLNYCGHNIQRLEELLLLLCSSYLDIKFSLNFKNSYLWVLVKLLNHKVRGILNACFNIVGVWLGEGVLMRERSWAGILWVSISLLNLCGRSQSF